jgi:hypothetical protein
MPNRNYARAKIAQYRNGKHNARKREADDFPEFIPESSIKRSKKPRK